MRNMEIHDLLTLKYLPRLPSSTNGRHTSGHALASSSSPI